MPKDVALSTDEQRREMQVIHETWALLSPLDTEARCRVLNWLRGWLNSEAPEGSRRDLDF